MPEPCTRASSFNLAALALSAVSCVVTILSLPLLADTPPEAAPEEINWRQERQFWSFQVPKAQPRPTTVNTAWPAQPIDFFILAKLEQKGLAPSGQADARTLIRRVTFDLTGLPPTAGEVECFPADSSPAAYERLVDRLLASPRFGERMASLWLPLARFAEDQAHQVGDDTKFFYPNAWRYRQWVINAFNRDLPYDQFLKLQLAADQIEGPRSENLAALGFLGLGPKYYNRNRLDVMADEWEDRVDTVTRTMMALTVSCARCHDHKFDPITAADYYALAGVFASTKMVNLAPDGQIDKFEKAEKMNPQTLHIVQDGEVQNLPLFRRGNVERKGPIVERRFVRILCESDPPAFAEGSGRKELAEAIGSRSNPLAARVIVNRVWAMLIGRPLVPTPSNFGHSGMPPTHPALLDDLAVRFMNNGWSIKSLVREIVLSSTYRQSSYNDPGRNSVDAANELLWRANRRRLTIEQWRDATLFVSGELAESGDGPSSNLDEPANHRRTVYARVSRLKLNDFLAQFDYPDANVHAEKRSVTTTPTQKLFMLNSPFMQARAKALADRLTADADGPDESRVNRAYRVLFGRDAQQAEVQLALTFLHGPATEAMSRWEQFAQILLACNEMLYVD